jgi:four helix bundle protein
MRDFHRLKVWEKAHRLALSIYEHTRHFPADERYGLTLQIRRATTSIPTNIAEGCGRSGDRELARFLSIAASSASELEYQILLSRDLGYVNADAYRTLNKQVIEVKRMLSAFLEKLTADG